MVIDVKVGRHRYREAGGITINAYLHHGKLLWLDVDGVLHDSVRDAIASSFPQLLEEKYSRALAACLFAASYGNAGDEWTVRYGEDDGCHITRKAVSDEGGKATRALIPNESPVFASLLPVLFGYEIPTWPEGNGNLDDVIKPYLGANEGEDCND